MSLRVPRFQSASRSYIYVVVKLVAGLCRLSLAFHAACNGSPNVMRSNTGQQVYAGHVCWLETACDDSAEVV